MSGVVLFSPSRFSLYSMCVAEELRQRGVELAGVAVTRLTDPGRLVREVKRDGRRLAGKVWQKLVLRERMASTGETLADRKARLGLVHGALDELAAERRVPLVYTGDLNGREVCDMLDRTRPHLVVFTGGGLIRQPVFERSGAGVVNCHSGVLPAYRGMDVIEWALLEDRRHQLGLAVHFMDAGVDTGPILFTEHVPIEPSETIASFRRRLLPRMSWRLAEAVAGFLSGAVAPRPQRSVDGRQYFIMHPRLAALVRPGSGDRTG